MKKDIDPYLYFLAKRMLEIEAVNGTGPCTTTNVKAYLYDMLKPIEDKTTFFSRERNEEALLEIDTIRDTILKELGHKRITSKAMEKILRLIPRFGYFETWKDFENKYSYLPRPAYLGDKEYMDLATSQKLDLVQFAYDVCNRLFERLIVERTPIFYDIYKELIVRMATDVDIPILEELEERTRLYKMTWDVRMTGSKAKVTGYKKQIFDMLPESVTVFESHGVIKAGMTLLPIHYRTFTDLREGKLHIYQISEKHLDRSENKPLDILLMTLANDSGDRNLLAPFHESFRLMLNKVVKFDRVTDETILCIPLADVAFGLTKLYGFEYLDGNCNFLHMNLISFLVRIEKMNEMLTFWRDRGQR